MAKRKLPPIVSQKDTLLTMQQKLILPHWEPFATAEYILDRAMAIHLHGHPLNQREILIHEPTLIRNAMNFFGNWDEVLRRIGLEPANIRRHCENGKYTKTFIKSELRRIFKETGDVTQIALIENGHSTLHQRTFQAYGSFSAGLKAAGIDANRFCKATRYQDDYDRFLERAKQLIGLYGRERRDLSRELRRDGQHFISSRFKNNWSRFAKENSIPISRLDRRGYPTRKDAIHELCRRRDEGLAIGQSVLVREDCPLHVAVIRFWGNYARLNRSMRRW
ncbi:MAG: hypothetical protein EA353_10640 [Puniceicoccaceae bacterium]|nr:MAG: hypothetical protein EA353_10640 [Puniceicoccaceae bacterium]